MSLPPTGVYGIKYTQPYSYKDESSALTRELKGVLSVAEDAIANANNEKYFRRNFDGKDKEQLLKDLTKVLPLGPHFKVAAATTLSAVTDSAFGSTSDNMLESLKKFAGDNEYAYVILIIDKKAFVIKPNENRSGEFWFLHGNGSATPFDAKAAETIWNRINGVPPDVIGVKANKGEGIDEDDDSPRLEQITEKKPGESVEDTVKRHSPKSGQIQKPQEKNETLKKDSQLGHPSAQHVVNTSVQENSEKMVYSSQPPVQFFGQRSDKLLYPNRTPPAHGKDELQGHISGGPKDNTTGTPKRDKKQDPPPPSSGGPTKDELGRFVEPSKKVEPSEK